MSQGRDLPPGLEDFGRRLEDMARRDATAQTRARGTTGRRIGWLPGAVLAALLAAAVGAGAAGLAGSDGPSIKGDKLAPDARPPLDPTVLQATRRSDPAGGLDWVLRVYVDPAGRECVKLGRLREGVFGQVYADGRFRALPRTATGQCGSSGGNDLLGFVDRRGTPATTAVFGLSPASRSVRLLLGDRSSTITPGPLGAYLMVVAGRVSPVRLSGTIDGRGVSRELG